MSRYVIERKTSSIDICFCTARVYSRPIIVLCMCSFSVGLFTVSSTIKGNSQFKENNTNNDNYGENINNFLSLIQLSTGEGLGKLETAGKTKSRSVVLCIFVS